MSTSTDLGTIIGNVSRSLVPVQHLITGFAYLLGMVFFITALSKFKKIAESGGRSQEKPFVPLAFFLGGAALVFLPTVMSGLANTAFGVGNVLQYTNYNPYDFYSSLGFVIQTAGVIWFVRGCILLVSASQPGAQHGPKGLVFLCAGILAMNFQNTVSAISTAMVQLSNLTLSFKGK